MDEILFAHASLHHAAHASPALPGRTSGSVLAVRFPCTRALPMPRTDLRLVLSVRSSSDEIGGGTDRHPDQALQARVARMSGAKSGNDQFARTLLPDYAALHPGYGKKRKWNAERRVCPTSAPPPSSSPACAGGQRRGRGARPAGRAASRHSTAALAAASQRRSSAPDALPGTRSDRGVTLDLACPSPASSSQTGHSAGRAFFRSRPGAAVTSRRPREPHSPQPRQSSRGVLCTGEILRFQCIRNGDRRQAQRHRDRDALELSHLAVSRDSQGRGGTLRHRPHSLANP